MVKKKHDPAMQWLIDHAGEVQYTYDVDKKGKVVWTFTRKRDGEVLGTGPTLDEAMLAASKNWRS